MGNNYKGFRIVPFKSFSTDFTTRINIYCSSLHPCHSNPTLPCYTLLWESQLQGFNSDGRKKSAFSSMQSSLPVDFSSMSGLTGSTWGPFISPLLEICRWTKDGVVDGELRFGSDGDFMTKCDKLDEDDPLVTLVTPADCDGNVLGVSTDSLFRDRLRYSNNETCQRTTNQQIRV